MTMAYIYSNRIWRWRWRWRWQQQVKNWNKTKQNKCMENSQCFDSKQTSKTVGKPTDDSVDQYM